jgi:hypothetical protein
VSYQKFDEEFVTRRLEEHKLMLSRRGALATVLAERQFMGKDLEIEIYEPKVGRPPLRKLTALAKKVMANASKPLTFSVTRDEKGRILPRKVRGASA